MSAMSAHQDLLSPNSHIPGFDASDVQTRGTRWKKWLAKLENYLIAMGITNDGRKKAMLLHYGRDQVFEIYRNLANDTESENYEETKALLTNYMSPVNNNAWSVFLFQSEKQQQGQSLDLYLNRLRTLIKDCPYTGEDVDKNLVYQIILGTNMKEVRVHALSTPDISLTALLTYGRLHERSQYQAASMSGVSADAHDAEKVNKISQKHRQKERKQHQTCNHCGNKWPHKGGMAKCPARGHKCHKCSTMNHFASVCMSTRREKSDPAPPQHRTQPRRRVNRIEDSPSDTNDEDTYEDNYIFAVHSRSSKLPHTKIRVNNTYISMMIDSGSTLNIVDENTYNKLFSHVPLRRSRTNVYAYGTKTPLPTKGEFTATLESKHKLTAGIITVVCGGTGNLLSYDTAQCLEVIHITNMVAGQMESDKLIQEYPQLFTGVGKLKDFELKLHIDDNVQPVAQRHRRVPFHVRKKVEAELQRLEDSDIIEKVNSPTPWISPIVTPPKPKSPEEVRICVDMRCPNTAIKRERHITPTVDDLILELNGSTVFSKVDLNKGYHQIMLAPESRAITTFSTHIGIRRYKRLNFGISCAAEKFQQIIEQVIAGIPGVKNIADDIIIHGKSQRDHDRSLRLLFARLSEHGLTLNKAKCEFNKDSIEYYGYHFSKDGISAEKAKVEALHKATPPTTPSEARSLLGMATYCSRFIPDFATISEPIRRLTRQNVEWQWGDKEQKALDELKTRLSSNTVMSYFEPSRTTEVHVDASPVGLGAVLIQRHPQKAWETYVVAFASRSLTDVESRYSQIEREALACLWAVQHFHLYLYGCPFTVVTDHKPLETIWNNPRSSPPARLIKWSLKLQCYDYKIKYQSGKLNAADWMSRHPLPSTKDSDRGTQVAEEYVNFLIDNAAPKAMSLAEIKAATTSDKTLQEVITRHATGNWELQSTLLDTDIAALRSFAALRSELTVSSDGVVLRGSSIVIPKSLQQRVIELAHEGHQGIVKTKKLLREKVWFPGIDRLTEEMVKSCLACQATGPEVPLEPLKMSPLPRRKWTNVSIDFKGPIYGSGEYVLVVIDEYSRYPATEIVKSTSANTVIPVLDSLFSMFGIPEVAKTDNGPPFSGEMFAKFAKYLGFTHRKITPLWPRANAEAERFMSNIGKIIQTAQIEQKAWKQELNKFLRNYRATPHSTTGVSPATIMFGSPISIKIPHHVEQHADDDQLRVKDAVAKSKMKEYADRRNNAKPCDLTLGDEILLKQIQNNQTMSKFVATPYQVIDKKGSMITARNEQGHTVTRNSSFMKGINKPTETPSPDPKVSPSKSPPVEMTPTPRYELRRKINRPNYLKNYVTK